MNRIDRHYWKCRDCLSPFAVEGNTVTPGCPLCGGKAEYMGRVQGERVVRDKEVCPCDFRCIFASGPNCDCGCGGENHGKGMVIVTEAVDKCSNVAKRQAQMAAKAKAVAAEWRAALEPLEAELAKLRAGGWLPAESYARRWRLESVLRTAKKRGSHKARMADLNLTKPLYV